MVRNAIIASFAAAFILAPALRAQPTAAAAGETRFTVRVENVSRPDAIKAPEGKRQAVGISPGAWVVHTGGRPLFTAGQYDLGRGLESQAEDGDPTTLAKSAAGADGVLSSGVFNMPVGKSAPGPLHPGDAFEFTVSAPAGSRLSMTMMFGHSNDWFYAPSDKGIPLFDAKGQPIEGDITNLFNLWDAGTEVDEEAGLGKYQATSQSVPNTGPSEREAVQPVNKIKSGFWAPAVSRVIRVTITPER